LTVRDINEVVISWVTPSSNSATDFGDVMIGFKIYLQTSDTEVYSQQLTYCPNVSTSVTSCRIPISVLEASPFSLTSGSSIYAKVLAYNSIGDGAFSIAGNGAIISTILVPDAPMNLMRDSVATTTS
jgi:hypothetical protein